MIIEQGIIRDIVPDSRIGDGTQFSVIDALGMDIVPGFIDIHVHGGGGADFMDANFDAIQTVTYYHCKGGTTSLLATTASARREQILETLSIVKSISQEQMKGARILGVHLEGPYFNFEKKGCHLPSSIRNPDPAEYNDILQFHSIIKRMTLAPELPGALELIKDLRKHNMLVSVGHSNAAYKLMEQIAQKGPLHTTHMYCAMSDVIKSGYKREAGIIPSVFLIDKITTELIADGKHLPLEILKLVVKIKGSEKIALCTDAMRGAGMPEGIYSFGPKDGNPARVRNGEAVTLDESGFASSVVQMIDLVRVMITNVGLSPEKVFYMASAVPAKVIGIYERVGSLEKGKFADFLVVSSDLKIKEVWIRGQLAVNNYQ